jgi:uncharacterized protein
MGMAANRKPWQFSKDWFPDRLMDDNLWEKLKSMGVKLGSDAAIQPQPPTRFPIESILPGEIVHNLYGDCFILQKSYTPEQLHGNVDLQTRSEIGIIAAYSKLPHLSGSSTEKLVFLDTETTGLSPSAGTFAFQIGLCRNSPQGIHFYSLLSRSPAEERAMLVEMIRILDSATAVVTYNGKSFDIPLLESRLAFHGISSPFRSLGHIDLLPLARRLWKNTLPSRSLSHIEMAILGVARSDEEVPGYLIPQLYYDYLKSGDAHPLVGVIYHNEMDVISMVALLNYLISLSSNPAELDRLNPLDIFSVIHLMIDIGDPGLVSPLLDSVFQQDDELIDWSVYRKLADWYKSRQDWEPTLLLLEKAGLAGQYWAEVELAKYYENRLKDADQALLWCEKALDTLNEAHLAPYTLRTRWQEILVRIERINRKAHRD